MTIIDPLKDILSLSAPTAKHEENSACKFCRFFFLTRQHGSLLPLMAHCSAFDCVSFAVALEFFSSSVSPASKLPSGFAVTLGSFVGSSIVIMRGLRQSGSAAALYFLAVWSEAALLGLNSRNFRPVKVFSCNLGSFGRRASSHDARMLWAFW